MIRNIQLRRKIRNLVWWPVHLIYLMFAGRRKKVFCLSMQRTGTTSVGEFLKDQGYRVARESDGVLYSWSYHWQKGNYDKIFHSLAFKAFTAYEDAPWWFPGFYKEVHRRFPDAKFILLYRDVDQWFDSMIKLKGGKTPGNTRRHCMIYDRMNEFNERLRSDPSFKPSDNEKDELMSMNGMRDHYTGVYKKHIEDVIRYFEKNAPEALITLDLNDPEKWLKIGTFLGTSVPVGYDVHANRSEDIMKR